MDVILKYTDGSTQSGALHAFNINQPFFHLHFRTEEGQIVSSPVRLDSVQQILFVKKGEDHVSPVRTEMIGESKFASMMGFRLTVEFKDATVLTGTAHKYDPNEPGFYLVPLNPADKSERIFVVAQAVARVDSVKLLGKILLDGNRITQKQLETGLDRQKKMKEMKLGTILQEKKIISDEQLRESLTKQMQSRKLLGEILLDAGYITSEQLDYALSIQQAYRKTRLGQVLVELKFLTPNDICIALATQFHCAWVDLSDVTLSPEIIASLPAKVVRRLEVIPVEERDDGVLVVASAEPQRPDLVTEISKATRLTVELAVAYEVYIAENIARYFMERQEPGASEETL